MQSESVISIPPSSFDLNFPVDLDKAEWKLIAERLIVAAQEKGVWTPLKQRELPLNENIMLEDPRQAIVGMISAGYLVYTEDGYWLTQSALKRMLTSQNVLKDLNALKIASMK